jgi:hypothetical protein
MVFRDDREALLLRLAALERDAAECSSLRARVAALEEENRRLSAALHALQPPPAMGAPPPPQPAVLGAFTLRVRGPFGIRDMTFDADVVKIGRSPTCHLHLDHPDVSRMHAVIERSKNVISIIDLGSAVGVRVDGRPVAKAALAPGNVIGIAAFEMTVVFA